MTLDAGTLIVGASQAGLQVAVSLRDAGETGPITLIGEEPHAPYQRPPLSKAYLQGSAELEQLWLRAPEVLAGRDISLVTGERIESIELTDGGPSGSARTRSGRVLTFDRLALTVGARPRRLEAPGADLDGVTYLRTADDATLLRDLQSDAQSVVVIGGGFIGLEAAAVARAQGKSVTVVEAADRLIGRAVAPVVSEFYRAAHSRRGVEIRLGTRVTWLAGDHNRVQAVELSDGTWIPADLVIVGIGVVPRSQLARQLNLDCDGGIVVDRFARTSNPTVVAAGDCTVQPNPLTGQRPGAVGVGAERHQPGQDRRRDPGRPERAERFRPVVLVGSVQPQASDRRLVRWPRSIRGPRRHRRRGLLGAVLPRGRAPRSGRRQPGR